MLSLSNAFTENDLINFEKKILNFLSKEADFNLSYSAEPKIDGISASLTYKNGEFKMGLSRGDGKEGEDITNNLATIKDIPKKIISKDFPDDIDVRGEVYIKNSDFKNLKDKFANPRNCFRLVKTKILKIQKNTFKFYSLYLWFWERIKT